MRFLENAALAVAVVFGVLSQAAEANSVTPFSLTDNGLTVEFLSSPNPNAFLVGPYVPFVTLHNNTLIEFIDSGNELGIAFSQPLNFLQLDFALSNLGGGGTLDYQALSGGFGGTTVASSYAISNAPCPYCFAEGVLTASAISFDAIILSTGDAPAFAIDNLLLVTADPPSTHLITFDAPEPLTLALFGAGLAGTGALRRRKKASLKA